VSSERLLRIENRSGIRQLGCYRNYSFIIVTKMPKGKEQEKENHRGIKGRSIFRLFS